MEAPLISILVPVYNIDDKYLEPCIESVLWQSYQNWELCLVDDHSSFQNIKPTLERYAALDARIKVRIREQNGGISECTNTALSMASGEYVSLLDCDDILAEDALSCVVEALHTDPSLDFIYTDEDKCEDRGHQCYDRYFKPDWSPDTFMSQMYTSHFGTYRRSILEEIGGFRSAFDGAQDYDMVLRFTERTKRIGHVSRILYHWRARRYSTADDPETKFYVFEATKKAKEEALARRGAKGKVTYIDKTALYRVTYDAPEEARLSVIVHGASGESQKTLLDRWQAGLKPQDEVLLAGDPVNAIEQAVGDYILFVHAALLPDESVDWRDILVGQASQSHTGAVGAKTIDSSGKFIMQNGIACMKSGWAYLYAGGTNVESYTFHLNKIDRNVLAVSADALCVQTKKLKQAGNSLFDARRSTCANESDAEDKELYNHGFVSAGIRLSLALYASGLYNVLRNDIGFIDTRGLDSVKSEVDTDEPPVEDPFYNRFLDQSHPQINLEHDPIVKRPHAGLKETIKVELKKVRESLRQNSKPYKKMANRLQHWATLEYNSWRKTVRKENAVSPASAKYKARFQIINVTSDTSLADLASDKRLMEIDTTSGLDVVLRSNDVRQTADAFKADAFIVFVFDGDRLSDDALSQFAKASKEGDYDLLYANEDWVNPEGTLYDKPFFKPVLSPELLLSYDYMGKACAYRKSVVRQALTEAALFCKAGEHETDKRRVEYDAELTCDEKRAPIEEFLYALKLNLLDTPERIKKVNAVTYHNVETSYTHRFSIPDMDRVKSAVLEKHGIQAALQKSTRMPGLTHVVYDVAGNPLTSIIIPSKDHPDILTQCIESIEKTCTDEAIEYIVVDNGSSEANKQKVEALLQGKRANYVYQPMDFNFSAMCNLGARHATGDILLFLNDDIEAFENGWLHRLVGQVQQEAIGGVGAKLYYPGGYCIQHDGIFDSKMGPANQFFYAPDVGNLDNLRNMATVNVLSVTGAAFCVRKSVFDEVGGFDEDFPVAYNDVDLGYRIYNKGYRNVLRNDVRLYHHESLSRGDDTKDGEKLERLDRDLARLVKRHPDYHANDPYYDKYAEENFFATYHLADNKLRMWFIEKIVMKL